MKRLIPVIALAPILLLAACSSSTSSDQATASAAASVAASSAASTAASSATGTAVAYESDCGVQGAPTALDAIPDGPTAGGVTVLTGADGAAAPAVVVASDAAPAAELISLDIAEGTGKAAKAGDTLTVQYCGVSVPEGTMFDSSWVRGEPATFPLDGLIAGWQEGIPGMKVGGTRLLVIPGDKAYGPNPPSGAGIAPNATLAFVITLTDVAAAAQ